MINHNPSFVFESVHALVSHAGNAETDRVGDLDPSAKNGAACRTRVSKPWKPETDPGERVEKSYLDVVRLMHPMKPPSGWSQSSMSTPYFFWI